MLTETHVTDPRYVTTRLTETERNRSVTMLTVTHVTDRNQPVTCGVNSHHGATDETAVKPTLTSNDNVTAHHLMMSLRPDPHIDDGPPNCLRQAYSNAGVPARIPRVPGSPQNPNRIGTAKGNPQTSRDDRALPVTPQPTGDHRLRACPRDPLTFGRKGCTGECCEPGIPMIHRTADCPLAPPVPSPATGGVLNDTDSIDHYRDATTAVRTTPKGHSPAGPQS